MDSADRTWKLRIDPIYGGEGSGRWAEVFGRLKEAVCLVRDTEVADDVAINMIRDAAKGHSVSA